MKIYLTTLLSLLLSQAFAQMNHGWAQEPEVSVVDEQYLSENVVGILQDDNFYYYYSTEGDLMCRHTQHRRFRLNSDEAINAFNKISVSLSGVIDVTEINARVIKPDGRSISFDKNTIKEVKDEEEGNNQKIFVIDGIEKGDDIEYMTVREMHGRYFGTVYFQYTYPLLRASFELSSPPNLIFASKGYNGFPTALAEKAEDRNKLSRIHENIPALKEMQFFYFQPMRARLEYKLEYNNTRGKAKVLTWDDAAQRIYEMVYADADAKSIKKWQKTINITRGTALEKATHIEEYIKSNIYVQDYNMPEFNDLEFIRTHKVSGEQGIVRLYGTLLKAYGIDHEIVLTSDRTESLFDPHFESWNYLSKYLIYLPEADTYIDPLARFLRIGCVDGDLTATYGLFVKLVRIGNFENAAGKIRYITPTPYQANYDHMNIQVSVDVDNGQTRIINTRGLKGLSGGNLGRIYQVIDQERKQELLKDMMATKAPNPTYNTLTVLPDSDIDFMQDATFIIHSDFTSLSFIEMAGNQLLLSIGESIGPQSELYYDEERTHGATSGHNRWYRRRIILEVPEGYRIVNPQACDMNHTGEVGGETAFAFISNHTYAHNRYTVEIEEYYKVIDIPAGSFEGFRKVINAAADFNKVVLVLEKE